jgi:hypothetical protein
MESRKGLKRFAYSSEDENRKQGLLAFWDFCRDCFGEERDVPPPSVEIPLRRVPCSHRSPPLRKLPF